MTMMDWLRARRTHLLALLLGAAGFAVAWGAWHLWQDHRVFHELVDLEIRRQQAIQQQMRQQQAPAPEPPSGPKPSLKGGG